ncbi:MAG TPA: hypothetical protein VK947_10070, partial [Planococcus sp. (in: firmicutes)]|nr:hypothetical protein [Planococcus sp. (in: firmicutes)]
TLHYRVVLIAQYCWRIAVRRRTIRFDLRKLISKLFVDVLLFSFQGSSVRRAHWRLDKYTTLTKQSQQF